MTRVSDGGFDWRQRDDHPTLRRCGSCGGRGARPVRLFDWETGRQFWLVHCERCDGSGLVPRGAT